MRSMILALLLLTALSGCSSFIRTSPQPYFSYDEFVLPDLAGTWYMPIERDHNCGRIDLFASGRQFVARITEENKPDSTFAVVSVVATARPDYLLMQLNDKGTNYALLHVGSDRLRMAAELRANAPRWDAFFLRHGFVRVIQNDSATWQLPDERGHPLSRAELVDFYNDLASTLDLDDKDVDFMDLVRACPYHFPPSEG